MENEWIEKLAIQDLLARYAHAIDDLDPWRSKAVAAQSGHL